jgi:hypothetical protein
LILLVVVLNQLNQVFEVLQVVRKKEREMPKLVLFIEAEAALATEQVS